MDSNTLKGSSHDYDSSNYSKSPTSLTAERNMAKGLYFVQ